jgi:hypothetical protein
MKRLYTLSALAIFNLVAVTFLSNTSIQNLKPEISQEIEAVVTQMPTPTPIVVKRQVVKKVTKYVTPTPGANNKVAATTATTTTQNQTQPNSTPQQQATPAPQAPTAPPAPSGCIITLDGSSYNVTSLQRTHSGGDVFNCGSDMSATFWGKHGQGIFNKMQQYRI